MNIFRYYIMGLGSSSSTNAKKLEGQNIVLNAKKDKMVVSTPKPGAPVQELTPLEGKLIKSSNGVHYLELESSDPANPEIIAVAASVYSDPLPASSTSPESTTSPTDENAPPMEEPEQPPANGSVAVTTEEPPAPMKGGKRKSAKSHRNNKKRNSRKKNSH